MSAALELSKDTREKLAALRSLSEKVEAGDKSARKELRKAVRESSPEVVAQASELAHRSQWALITTAAAGESLVEEALLTRLDLLRVEIAGENPSALERLLTEKIVGAWLLGELLELLNSAQLTTGVPKDKRIEHSFLKFYLGWQEQAHRRLFSSIKTLAQVRRLQSLTPGVQVNIQNNLLSSGPGSSLPIRTITGVSNKLIRSLMVEVQSQRGSESSPLQVYLRPPRRACRMLEVG